MARAFAIAAVIVLASMLGAAFAIIKVSPAPPADDLSLYLRANPRGVPSEAPN